MSIFKNIRGFCKGDFGFFYLLYMVISLLISKIHFPMVKIIRLPYFIRVKGNLLGLEGLSCGRSLRVDVHDTGVLNIGRNVEINDHCQIACSSSVAIEDNVTIASKVFITDHDHYFDTVNGASKQSLISKPVIIRKNCWIGNGASILKGVEIGEGSIVGSGAVVTRSFPPGSIILGVPARGRPIKNSKNV